MWKLDGTCTCPWKVSQKESSLPTINFQWLYKFSVLWSCLCQCSIWKNTYNNQPTQMIMNWLLLTSLTYHSLKSLVENGWDSCFHMTIPTQQGVIPNSTGGFQQFGNPNNWDLRIVNGWYNHYQILDGTSIPTSPNKIQHWINQISVQKGWLTLWSVNWYSTKPDNLWRLALRLAGTPAIEGGVESLCGGISIAMAMLQNHFFFRNYIPWN